MLELFLYSLIQGVWKTSSSGEVKRKCYCWLGVKRAVVIKELRTYQWSSVGAELAWCCYFFVGLELECTHLWLWLGSSLTCWSICLFSPFPNCASVWVWDVTELNQNVKRTNAGSRYCLHCFSCWRVQLTLCRGVFFFVIKTTGKVWQFPMISVKTAWSLRHVLVVTKRN